MSALGWVAVALIPSLLVLVVGILRYYRRPRCYECGKDLRYDGEGIWYCERCEL